ncbi:MAG: hypothetical protein AABY18_03960 [Candidatus Thermoplasmatota archaeon]
MNGRTQILIGLSVVLLGLGVVALAFLEDEASVRRVEDLVAQPGKHGSGSYVLLGVPQPPQIPLTGATGVTLAANPDWSNTTATTASWTQGDATFYSTRTVTVHVDGKTAHWAWRNETRRLPSDPDLAFPAEERTWTTTGADAFTVQAFDDGDGDTPRVWALYGGPLKDPMQPKPSQFTGRLATTLPDGTPVPDGVLVYEVDEFKAGCSSKFLPPEEKARREESGDL